MLGNGRDEKRLETMRNFLNYLNKRSDKFVLKGGTCLLLFYGLNRMSEDLDFDSVKDRIENIVVDFCRECKLDFRMKKNTATVEKFFIMLDDGIKTLKIEVSHRENYINDKDTKFVNGIRIYKINKLAELKSTAYVDRSKLRDLFDVCFIVNNYWQNLSLDVQQKVSDAFIQRTFDNFTYVTKEQSDPLIDEKRLRDDFIEAYIVADEFNKTIKNNHSDNKDISAKYNTQQHNYVHEDIDDD